MPEKKIATDQSPWNLGRDIVVTACFIGALALASLWFEIRKNSSDFYPTDWIILASFDLGTTEQAARDTDFLANDGGEGKFKASASMQHKLPDGQALTWTRYTAPQGEIPLIILGNIIGAKNTNVVAYAQTTLTMPENKQLQMGVSADDGIKIWLNGEVILDRGPVGQYVPDQNLVEVNLKQGENQLLVKNTQLNGGWGFAIHFLTNYVRPT